MRKMIFVLALIMLLALICFATACGPSESDSGDASQTTSASQSVNLNDEAEESQSDQSGTQSGANDTTAVDGNTTVREPFPLRDRPDTLEEQMESTIQATITMEDGGVIVLELYPDVAPESVRNFVYLARDGFYDGLKFHRIISGFMIQGGCPLGTGTGNPGYSIKGEFALNGFSNELRHSRGVLSMARSQHPNSAGSQFFIMHEDSPHLDGSYAAFGQVISGMDVVDRIAQTRVTDGNGSVAAENMPVMKSITIDDDRELPEPEKLG